MSIIEFPATRPFDVVGEPVEMLESAGLYLNVVVRHERTTVDEFGEKQRYRLYAYPVTERAFAPAGGKYLGVGQASGSRYFVWSVPL